MERGIKVDIEDIKKKHIQYMKDRIDSRGCCDIEDFSNEVEYLLSVNEQQKDLLDVVVSMVDEIRKPTPSTESGSSKLIALDTLIQRFLYYKQYPNELSSYLKAIRGN